jgi:hypothetical protein
LADIRRIGLNNFHKIREAVEARNKFLSEHPELMPLQLEIEETLRKGGANLRNRQALLQDLMLKKLSELGKHMGDLHKLLTGK